MYLNWSIQTVACKVFCSCTIPCTTHILYLVYTILYHIILYYTLCTVLIDFYMHVSQLHCHAQAPFIKFRVFCTKFVLYAHAWLHHNCLLAPSLFKVVKFPMLLVDWKIASVLWSSHWSLLRSALVLASLPDLGNPGIYLEGREPGDFPTLTSHAPPPENFPTIIIINFIVNVVLEATRGSLRCCKFQFFLREHPPDPLV